MAGTLVIPNAFVAQSGNVPASQLDANWNAVRDYVNPREVLSGTLAARPAFGVAGRWYFANNVNGGTLFIDTGIAWLAVAQGLTATGAGSYQVTGLVGANNATTPNTKYDLSADLVQLRNPTDGSIVVRTNTGTITNDLGNVQAANGRDQVAEFTASSWIHFYFIWNGTTLATLSSAVAPPTGPTLPSGYTHWAYAGAVRFNASSALVATRMRGAWAYYEAFQVALSGGTATAETAVSVSTLVPPNAGLFQAQGSFTATTDRTGAGVDSANVRYIAGFTFTQLTYRLSTNDSQAQDTQVWTMPNQGQQFFYQLSIGTTGANPSFSVNVQGYSISNGGE